MEELVEKAKNDDKRAFSELIMATEKELYLIAKSKLKSDDDIGDAIQETIYKSYKNIKKLRDNSVFKTWIIKILINKIINKIIIIKHTITIKVTIFIIKENSNAVKSY